MNNKLNITHLSSLSKALHIPLSELLKISQEIQDLYSTKRIKKADGNLRELSAPKNKLKNVQKKINKYLLVRVSNLESVHGWVKQHSSITATINHVNKSHIYSFDIKSFFNSIHSTKVYQLFNKDLGCSPSVSQILVKLTTYKHKIPQGSPCSPLIANLVLKLFDEDMMKYAQKRHAIYSRYGDDLIISSAQRLQDIEFVFRTTLKKHGLKLKDSKKVINANSNKSSVKVLGLVVGRKLTIHKAVRRNLRAILHNAETTGITKQNIQNHPHFRQHIAGRIAQIKSVQPKVGKKLAEKLNKISE